MVLELLGLSRLCESPAGMEEWIFLGVVLKLPGLDILCGSPAGGDLSTCEWIFLGVVLELPGLASSVDPQLGWIYLFVSGYFLEWCLNFQDLPTLWIPSWGGSTVSTWEWLFPGVMLGLPGLARLRRSPAGGNQSTCEWIFLGVLLKLPGLAGLI